MSSTSAFGPGRQRHSQLLALEPRMIFDAAAIVTAAALDSGPAAAQPFADPASPTHGPTDGDHAAIHLPGDTAERAPEPPAATRPAMGAADHPVAEHTLADPDRTLAAEPTGDVGHDAAPGRAFIFIDTSIADYKALAAQWADRGTVVLIDAQADGLDQVRAALAGQADVGAIHLVSHGAEGVLWLGTTRLDQASIDGELAASLGAVGRSLAPGGDILVYGCDFAEGADGAAALQALATATHADVAASTDLTGDARLGGDWTLEAHHGAIEATALAARDWHHTLDPDQPVPIAVPADSLTVTYNGTTVVTGATGYGNDGRSPDVGQGAVARWTGVATYQGQSLDLVATVVSLTSGDAIRFNRPTSSTNGENPTFLLRDLTQANNAQVQLQWGLVLTGTTTPVAADVEFGILDIDGIGGQPFTRESVTASTQGLAYYSREQTTDIYFQASLDQVTASGTQNENTDASKPLSTASEATFDWKNVSTWTLTYTLATNNVTPQAQFYQDGNFDFHYQAPVYTSIPRLDLDADDSTAPGNDAHFTFTEKGPASAIVDSDVRVSNPMDINSVMGASVTLTNAKPGDQLLIGTLPTGITATTATNADGSITATLSGAGNEGVYDQALRAVTFTNSSTAPDTTQRVLTVSFHNDTLTSAVATSRIDVIPVNDPPQRVGTLADQAAADAGTVSYPTAAGFTDPDGDTLTYSATGLPAGLTIDASTGVISGTLGRSASQANGGRYAISVTATDPSNTAATQSFTLTVTNPSPVARNDSAATDENSAVTVAVLANDSDPDGDPLTITAASAQHGTVTRNADGTLTYTPDRYFHGSDTISYTISDGEGGTSSATVAVTVAHVNQAPQPAAALPDRAAQDASTVSYATATAFSDPDGDTLTYRASGLPANVSIDASTGVISGTLGRSASQANGGRYPITVTATDPSGASDTQGFTLSVGNPPPVAQNDRASTDENTPVTIAVLANDSDPDGNPLTVTAASAQHGTVARNADGTLTYTPDRYFHGSDTISYTIGDGEGGTSSATVAVTVAHVNQEPVAMAGPIAVATQDGQAIDASITSLFSDPDGDTLTYSASGLPAGLSIDPSTGRVTGTVDRSASQVNGGTYTVTLTATDPSGASATLPVTGTVTNPPPVARDDAASTDENTPVTIPVLANDSDPDGDPLTVTAASAQHGSVARNADGTLTYTPDRYFYGSDTIRYTISDGQGGTSSASVAVTVAHVNQAPQPAGTLPDRTAQDAGTVSYPTAPAFGDPDGDTLTYSATGLPAGLSIDPATGVIAGTLSRSASQVGAGQYAIAVTATDPSGLSATQRFALAVTNPPPTAQDDTAGTNENTGVTIPVLSNDRDPDGDPLTVTAASARHGSVTRNADGALTYTPDRYFYGSDTISYTISDGEGGTSSATVAVTVAHVNQSPQPAGPLPDHVARDAATVSYATAPAFADPDGDALTYTATGLPIGLAIDPATGVIAGTLDRAASQANGGRYAIAVTATDPSGAATTRSFTLTAINPPPVAQDDAATTNENTPVTIPVLANDSDPDGDPLTVTTATAQHGSVARNADGTLTYTPDPNFYGSDKIAYTISDGQGGTSSASVTVTIAHVDQPPQPTGPLPDRAASDGDAVSLPTAAAFSDPDGDALRYSATGLPPGLAIDPATGVIAGTLGRSASQANGGDYAIAVTATDPSGLAATQRFELTVTDPAPVAQDDTAATNENTPVTIPVLANDRDPDGDPLTVTGAVARHGSVARNPDGTLTYTPDRGFYGTDTIAYTITDGEGGISSASVAVTVARVNQAPQPAAPLPDRAAQDADTVSFATASGFSDPDGDRLTYRAAGLPAGLSIDPATGVIAGVLDHAASQANGGRYAIVVTATDPSGAAATQGFALSVTNPPPVAVDDPLVRLHTGASATVPVLANDRDPDGDPLSVTAAAAQHGSVAVNPDGTLTYTAAAGYVGDDTISYTIGDGEGGTASARVPVSIGNAAPVADPLPDQAASDAQPISLALAPAFRDADGDPLTFSAAGLPPGLTIDPVTGIVSGTVDRSASQANGGAYASTITADDGHGGSVTAPLRWTVANPQPVAADDRATTPENVAVTIPVLANDRDPDGDPLSVTAAQAQHGTVAVNADGTLTYTPDRYFSGTDTIAYTIADGQGGIAAAQAVVTVTHVNQPPQPVGAVPAQRGSDGGTVTIPTAAGFADPDGDPLTYSATGLPPGLFIDPATGLISGRLPADASLHGPYRVTVTATDPAGASTTQPFTLAVDHPAPAPANDTASTPQETPVTLAVLGNDASPSGAPLTVTAATAQHGTVSVNADGTLAYTPATGFRGTDTIGYTVADPEGGTGSASVAVTVTPVDHAPVATATPPAQSGSDGAPVRLDLGGFFADRDGDPLTYSATGLPAGLAIDPGTGVIGGTPAGDPSRTGPYHVTVTASDPSGASAASGFDWTFAHPAPVARDDAGATAAWVPVAIPVLANDSDPAGDALTVTAAAAAHGAVTIGPDGVLLYTPAAGFTGQDVISYTITDASGAGANASVLVTVTPLPQARDGTAQVTPDATAILPVLGLASDPAGLPLAVTAVVADHGTATIGADGTVRYTPGPGFTGTDLVHYTVTDAHGGTATALVSITVAVPDQAPVIPGRAPVDAVGGLPVRLDLLAGVTDPDGDPVTLADASAAVGRLTRAPGGTITYTAPLGFAGATTITYTVSDGRGGLATDTLVVRVADGRGADINALLRIGTVRYVDPTPALARVTLGPDGEARNPLALLRTAEALAPWRPTAIGDHPVDDAVNAARALGGTAIDPAQPVGGEVARLGTLVDRRDAAGRLLDPRWGDLAVRGFSGFSAASDAQAGVMVESVIRGDALYVEVRDTAAGRLSALRTVDVRLASGERPNWLRVDAHGLAIVECPADRDELHLLVRITRADRTTATTRIVIQRATGEVELDRHRPAPAPLAGTLTHPRHHLAIEAHRLATHFQ